MSSVSLTDTGLFEHIHQIKAKSFTSRLDGNNVDELQLILSAINDIFILTHKR